MPTKTQIRFRKLLEDVNKADKKILRLFPSMDFWKQGNLGVALGLKTDLRILLIAAERDYVNEYILSEEYAVGGDSRHRVLPRLQTLGFLSRSEETSSRGGKKFMYALSDKGVILCSAFQRIYKSNRFVTLIKNFVSNLDLKQVMLVLYFQGVKAQYNRLLQILHQLSDKGCNIENVSEAAMVDWLLQTEQSVSTDPRESFLFELLEEFVDQVSSLSEEDVSEFINTISNWADIARSDPSFTKRFLVVIREGLQFLHSSDFRVWMLTSKDMKKDLEHLVEIFFEIVGVKPKEISLKKLLENKSQIPAMDETSLKKLWEKRSQIFLDVLKRLRKESYSRIEMMKEALN